MVLFLESDQQGEYRHEAEVPHHQQRQPRRGCPDEGVAGHDVLPRRISSFARIPNQLSERGALTSLSADSPSSRRVSWLLCN